MVVASRCFAFRALVTQVRIWKKFSSSKTRQVFFIYPFLRRLNLGKSLQRKSVFFFCLSWHFKREKSVFWKASFDKTRTDSRLVLDFGDKALRLVRISLLISATQRVLRFSSGNLFHKSNRKLFSCFCIAWHKHSRRWENSRQLCKLSTSSRVCIIVSNSPNPSRVYIRLCKLGKRFLLLN